MRTVTKTSIAVGAGLLLVGALGGYVLARPASKLVRTDSYDVPSATVEQLEEIGELRIFFGHQSVGANILNSTSELFSAAGARIPKIVESDDAGLVDGPMIIHSFIGENRDPLGKVTEFDRILREGMGEQVDVALLKLCYIDVTEGVDVEALFADYRDMMSALEQDFPDVVFLYATVPLTTEAGGPVGRAKERVKDFLGRDYVNLPANNVTREQFNELIRAEYRGTGRLFDVAAVQAAGADGIRQVRSHSGVEYFAMDSRVASDPGHLNGDGSLLAGSALFAIIAQSTP